MEEKATTFIKCECENGVFVWKHPAESFDSSCVVDVKNDQEAVFAVGKEIIDILPRGSYRLTPQATPGLTRRFGRVAGINDQFQCQLYFVNKATPSAAEWEFDEKIQYMDPKLSIPVFLGAKGSVAFKVANTPKILMGSMGNDCIGDQAKLMQILTAFVIPRIKAYIMRYITTNKTPITELENNIQKLTPFVFNLLYNDLMGIGVQLFGFRTASFDKQRAGAFPQQAQAPQQAQMAQSQAKPAAPQSQQAPQQAAPSPEQIAEGFYMKAMALASQNKFDEAIEILSKIPKFKDSEEKIELIKQKKEDMHKEATYTQAIQHMKANSNNIPALKKIIEIITPIADYKDTKKLISTIEARCEELKVLEEKRKAEAEKLAAEKKVKQEKRKRAMKRFCKIGIPIIAFVVAAVLTTLLFIVPTVQIGNADDLLVQGKYDEALKIYKDLDGFSNSDQRISVAKGAKQIQNGNFKGGINAILSAGVPVTLTYNMGGGDFSGNAYLSANGGSVASTPSLLSSTGNTVVVPLADGPAATVVENYAAGSSLKDIKTPGRQGYTFIKWKLASQTFTVEGGEKYAVVLTAEWSCNDYSISYNLNGGKMNGGIFAYTAESDDIVLPIPTKTGYTFLGWTGTDLSTPTKNVTIPKGSAGNRSYKANWKVNDYTITFNTNGGTLANGNELGVSYGSTYILPTPVKAGHTFIGWFDSNDIKYTNGSWSRTEDVVLIAEWEVNTYSIYFADTYVDNTYLPGSTSTKIDVTYGNTYTLISNVIRPGYTFVGWYSDASLTAPFVPGEYLTDGDTTLYPKFTANSYTVTLDPRDGEFTGDTEVTVTFDASYDLGEPTMYGYDFLGWYYINGSDETYVASTGTWEISKNVELYAKYGISEYVLTLENIEHISGEDYIHSATSSIQIDVVFFEDFTLPTPTRTGHTFGGWVDGEGTPYESGEWLYATDLTLFPVWNPITYTVTLEPNDGTVDPTSMEIPYDAEYELPTPYRQGYEFLGWLDENGDPVDLIGTWAIAEDCTLTAGWEVGVYTGILDDTNGGCNVTYNYNYTDCPDPVTVFVANGETLSYPTPPTRSDYIFAGWYLDAECTDRYGFSENITEDFTLYAKWIAPNLSYESVMYVGSSVYVTYNSNDPEKYPFVPLVSGTITVYSTSNSVDTYGFLYNSNGDQLIYNDDGGSDRNFRYSYSVTAGELYYIGTRPYSGSSGYCTVYISGTYTPTSSATVTNAGYMYDDNSTFEFDNNYGSSYELPTPVRPGYTFLGWTVNGEPVESTGTWTYETDVTFVPTWEITTYTLTIVYADGVTENETVTLHYGDEFTLDELTRVGYDFLGWFDEGGTEYTSGTWTTESDVTVTASWEAHEHTITFEDSVYVPGSLTVTYNFNGGSGSTSSVTLDEGDTLSYPTKPWKSGYVFLGWFTDSACTTPFNFDEELTEDTTLYAGWLDLSTTYGTSFSNPDPTEYTSGVYLTVTPDTATRYIIVRATESGSHSVKCNSSSTYNSGRFYVSVYNYTTSTSIYSSSLVDEYTRTITFDCAEGDIIVIGYSRYSDYISAYFWFSGFESVTSTVTAAPTPSVNYGSESSYAQNVEFGEIVTLHVPYRQGYTFLGWYNGDDLVESGAWSIDSDVTLTPMWEVTDYVITLDPAGGSINTESITLNYGDDYTLSDPTRTGYDFAGWFDEAGTQYTSGTWTLESDLTLTARWTAHTHSVTFEDVSGVKDGVRVTYDYNYAGSVPSIVAVAEGATLSYPTMPTRSGYVFTGWYTDADCTVPYDFTGDITSNMTLYAGWYATSSFNASAYYYGQVDPTQYTTSAFGCSTSSTSSSYPYQFSIVALESGEHTISYYNYYSSTRYGYYLTITNLTSEETLLDTTRITSTSAINLDFECEAGDLILVSFYRSNSSYTSTAYFLFDGFETVTSTATAVSDYSCVQHNESSSISTTVSFGDNVVLPTPNRFGYTFLGWYNGDDLVESGAWSIDSDVTLTPMWEESEYTITLDANGGECSETSITVSMSDTVTLPTPTWEGHTFLGWYNGRTLYTGGTWTNDTDITLVAKWSTTQHTVTFDDIAADSATVTIVYDRNYPGCLTSEETYTNGEDIAYPSTPVRSGYTFTGWYTDPECTEFFDFSENVTEDITLYAGWVVVSSTQFIDPTEYSYETPYQRSTSGTNQLSPYKFYILANEEGTHAIYYSNSTSAESSKYYLTVRNAATGELIMAETAVNHEVSAWLYFNCDAGTVIEISLYRYSSNSTASFYFIGFTAMTSNSKAEVYASDLTYDTESTFSETANYGEEFTLPTPVRPGYTFTGWYNGETLIETETITITGDITLTPSWSVNSYGLTFDTDCDTENPEDMAVTYDTEFTLPVVTRTGYTFAGWYNGETLIENGTWNYTEDMALVAHWTANTYNIIYKDFQPAVTITYDFNYEGSTPSSVVVNAGDTLTYPTVPTRTNYVFTGWYTDADCTNEYTFSNEITADMTLYAGWGSYTVSSYYWTSSNGVLYSTNKNSSSSSYYQITAQSPITVTFQYRVSSEANYDYLYIRKNGANVVPSISGNTSYTTCTVSLDTGDVLKFMYTKDGSQNRNDDCAYIKDLTFHQTYESTATVSATQGICVGEATYNATISYDSELNLPTITRPGYTFTGWYIGNDINRPMEDGIIWNYTEDLTLFPMWTSNIYTVTFDYTDGDGASPEDATVSFGAPFDFVEVTRTGYTFGGWSYNGTVLHDGDEWNIPSDVTLTPVWIPNTYNVTFNDTTPTRGTATVIYVDNNGSSNTSLTYNNGDAFPADRVPTKAGYIFKGWCIDEECTILFDNTQPIDGDTILYAKWEEFAPSDAYQTIEIAAPTYTSSNTLSISTYGTNSTTKQYRIITAHEAGEHKIYFTAGNASGNELFNLSIVNNTTGDVIRADAEVPATTVDTPFESATFNCNAGDTIILCFYSIYDGYSTTAQFYFEGFEARPASTSTVLGNVTGFNYSVETFTMAVEYDSVIDIPTPVRDGYTFDGWYIGTEPFTSETWTITEDITLTPYWSAN
ncbi:MAG: InlB B-repeat-containing protein [Clostridia bacterium]|nr:InlB B-repeat-containing protein [Clostridia bacterium]